MSGARDGGRGIPTSRAYWELQAEKLLNRVFEPVETIDLEPVDPLDPPISASAGAAAEPRAAGDAAAVTPSAEAARRWPDSQPQPLAASQAPAAARESRPPLPSPAATRSAPAERRRPSRRPPRAGSERAADGGMASAVSAPGRSDHSGSAGPSRRGLPQPLLLVAVFAGAGLITATSGVLALSQWNRFQESLQQERNLLLVERLRSFGPAAQPAPAAPAATPEPPTLTPPVASSSASASGGPVDDGGLPPPPPSEPWIQELGSLPQPRPSAPLLRVPVSPALRAAAQAPPPPPRPRKPAGPVPLLVGVVAAPGKPGSAIFQMGGSTSTVSVGDSIGTSGWRLIASDGDGVQIEHQGEVRRISIGGGG